MADWSFDSAAIRRLVDHPKVQAEVDRRADLAVAAAIARCPISALDLNGAEHTHLITTIGKERVGHGQRVSYGGPKAPYAPHVEYGTRAHEIVARGGGFLRFESGGVVFYRKRVWHPGTKPHWVITGAAMDAARSG